MIGDYDNFLNKFLDKDYKFVFFSDFKSSKDSQIILRHDIDHSCAVAHKMAKMEFSKKIHSTYFFLITNNSYNLLSSKNKRIVQEINKMGHKISLHFDPSIYNDINEGLLYEIDLFQMAFDVKIDIISLHKPLPLYLDKNKDSQLINFSTTYDDKFFKEISYFADSRGSFRFGNPYDSKEFIANKNMQLLIHPMWWFGEGVDKHERVEWVKKIKFDIIEENLRDSIGFYGK